MTVSGNITNAGSVISAINSPTSITLASNNQNVATSLAPITFTSSAPITFAGTVNLIGNNTITSSGLGGVVLQWPVTDNSSAPGGSAGSLIVNGIQPVFLTNANANNNFTGGFALAGTANVVVGDNNAFGTGAVAFNGGTLVANTAVSLANPFVVNANTTINGTSSSANITFTGPGLLTGECRYNGSQSGRGSLSQTALAKPAVPAV